MGMKTMVIELEPREMTPELMMDLESRGLIIRLCPGNHSSDPGWNESKSNDIYISEAACGPHKLIVATINTLVADPYFGTHIGNEEFLMIGDPATKPLYLIVSLSKRGELIAKINSHSLSADDFVALHIKYNDPEVSFFTMLADVPHGEVTVESPGEPPSFYVTEGRDLIIDRIDFGDYQVNIKH
jgi:hypothetical protein